MANSPVAIAWVANRNLSNTDAVDIWISYNKNYFAKNGVSLVALQNMNLRLARCAQGDTYLYTSVGTYNADTANFYLPAGGACYIRPGSDYSGWSTCIALYLA